MASQISPIGGEYKVRTITGDEFDVIYTHTSATVKGCLSRFRHMSENSHDEWVAGLDVEYTTVLEREKILKEAKRKKPAVIQVCVHNVAWFTTYAMTTLSARILRTSLRTKQSNLLL